MRKYFIVLLLCAFMAGAIGCSRGCRKQGDPNLVKVRYGVSPFQDTLVPMLGKEKGWYKEEGLDVEFSILGWTEVQEGLSSAASSRIDVGINNISSVIATHHKNPELIYFYGFNTFDNGFALMVRPDSDLEPLAHFLDQGYDRDEAIRRAARQLQGRTVITTENTDMEQGVAAVARRGGLDFTSDINIINLNPDEGLSAFLTGEGDAFIGGIPQRTRAAKQGMVEMITGADLGPPPINGMVTTRTYLREHPEVLYKLLKVWFRIVQYIDENPDQGGEIIIKILNQNSAASFTVDDFKRFWNHFEHYPATPDEIHRVILSPDGRNYWKARWDDCNNYFHGLKGVIPEPVKASDAFYMQQAHDVFLRDYNDK